VIPIILLGPLKELSCETGNKGHILKHRNIKPPTKKAPATRFEPPEKFSFAGADHAPGTSTELPRHHQHLSLAIDSVCLPTEAACYWHVYVMQ
jgi:hypothetical protein